MANIYTRTGDTGETALFGGGRVGKDDLRIQVIGTVDELNAALGVVRAEIARSGTAPAEFDPLLAQLQHQLFDVGAELAAPRPKQPGGFMVSDSHVKAMEVAIDRCDAQLEPLRAFILPGGVPAAAQLHVARGVCRRAERRLVELNNREPVRGELLRYLNRLSDLLFVLARAVNRADGTPDVTWQSGSV
jgi:cob(I)alamin adenosyltransferase